MTDVHRALRNRVVVVEDARTHRSAAAKDRRDGCGQTWKQLGDPCVHGYSWCCPRSVRKP
jgi:hypothetical protein